MQINLRCFSCQTPFSLKPEEIESALNLMHQQDLKHYNALCPRCGKANKIGLKRLKRAAPHWKPEA
jgi:hypothetical protein